MSANNLVGLAVAAVSRSRNAFCKFTSANDAGSTGAHQAGYYIPKTHGPLCLIVPVRKERTKTGTSR